MPPKSGSEPCLLLRIFQPVGNLRILQIAEFQPHPGSLPFAFFWKSDPQKYLKVPHHGVLDAVLIQGILPQYIHMGLDHIRVYPHVSAEWNFWQWIAQFAMVPLVTMFFFWLCNFGAWSGARLSFSKWTSLLTVLILNFCLLGAFWLPMAVASFPKIPQKMLPVLAVMLSVLLGLYTRQYGCVSCGTLAQRGLRLLRWR